MNVYFNETFKSLRKSKDLTQEQIAEILAVSPQAVSRWETGATYPDITLLPTIAEFFETTVDALLGVEKSRREEKIAWYLANFQDAVNQGLINDCIEIMRTAVKEFPNNYVLLNKLMYALFLSGDNTGNIEDWKENARKYDDEIIEIGERILKYCTDDEIRLEAKARLGFNYCDTDNRLEKGRAIFLTLPSEDSSKEYMLYWALTGEDRLSYLRERIKKICSSLAWTIQTYANHSDVSPEEKLAWLNKSVDIVRSVFEESDLGRKYRVLSRMFAEQMSPLYLEAGNKEDALACLEKAAEYLRLDSLLPERYIHTSPLIREPLMRNTAIPPIHAP